MHLHTHTHKRTSNQERIPTTSMDQMKEKTWIWNSRIPRKFEFSICDIKRCDIILVDVFTVIFVSFFISSMWSPQFFVFVSFHLNLQLWSSVILGDPRLLILDHQFLIFHPLNLLIQSNPIVNPFLELKMWFEYSIFLIFSFVLLFYFFSDHEKNKSKHLEKKRTVLGVQKKPFF